MSTVKRLLRTVSLLPAYHRSVNCQETASHGAIASSIPPECQLSRDCFARCHCFQHTTGVSTVKRLLRTVSLLPAYHRSVNCQETASHGAIASSIPSECQLSRDCFARCHCFQHTTGVSTVKRLLRTVPLLPAYHRSVNCQETASHGVIASSIPPECQLSRDCFARCHCFQHTTGVSTVKRLLRTVSLLPASLWLASARSNLAAIIESISTRHTS